jgi:alpha-beta hydrolase superfamily lysophospholipase
MTNTILMIHGVGSSADAFVKLAPAFRERGWQVETPTLRPDLRKHDAPGPDLHKVSLADYLADVTAIARKLAKETGSKPVVLGHSMGGLLAQKLAEAGLASAAILVTPASPPDARAGRALAQAYTFANILFSGKPENRSHRIWRRGFSWGVLNRVPKARHADLWKGNLYDSGRVYADLAYPDEDPNRTCFVDETKINVPMLIIGSGRDRTTPVADVRKAYEKYGKAGADYVEYANHGHWIVDEPGTDRVIEDIAGWLDGKGLSPAKAAKPKPAAKPAPKKAAPAKAKAPVKAKPVAKPVAKAKAPAKPAARPKRKPAKA